MLFKNVLNQKIEKKYSSFDIVYEFVYIYICTNSQGNQTILNSFFWKKLIFQNREFHGRDKNNLCENKQENIFFNYDEKDTQLVRHI